MMAMSLIIGFIALLFSAVFFVIHVALCVWAYRDSRRRGRTQEFGLLAAVGLFFFPVLGLVVYLIIRND
ncbi:hypothetical protein MJA45_11210 [Paenibacillus aurantius]|uniref:Cardiolipin synthase N-terminal domain-containing protein n=1 Tax=Paenibacillus aurantius TaxID=2918900 RepID=A0AA96LGQ7_9BACL|nr:hypothetical protein [Paenibacillus aurantius]WNQ13551.1 hypothetical protein MJA45_11210 [Paenibacillus aurantius]